MAENEFDDEALDFASSVVEDEEGTVKEDSVLPEEDDIIVDDENFDAPSAATPADDITEDTNLSGDIEDTPEVPSEETYNLEDREDDNDYDVTTAATEETHGGFSDVEKVEQGLSSLAMPLNKIIERNGSATDIASFAGEVFASVLSFDKFSEMSTRYNKNNDLVDTSIMLDDRIKILVKSAASDRDLEALNLNLTHEVHSRSVRWLILTTGKRWIIYRDLGGDVPLFVAEFDFFDQSEAVNYLKYFTRSMFVEEGTDAILDKYRETFMDIAKEAIMSDQALQIIKEALAAKNMHIGTSVVRTVAKGVLKDN